MSYRIKRFSNSSRYITLYHVTKKENLPSIKREGLKTKYYKQREYYKHMGIKDTGLIYFIKDKFKLVKPLKDDRYVLITVKIPVEVYNRMNKIEGDPEYWASNRDVNTWKKLVADSFRKTYPEKFGKMSTKEIVKDSTPFEYMSPENSVCILCDIPKEYIYLDEPKTKRFSLISRGLRFIKELKHLDPLPMTIEEYSIFLFHFEEAKKFFKGFKPRIKESEDLKKRVNDFYKNPKASDIISHIGMGIVFGNTYDFYRRTYLGFTPEYGKDKDYTKALEISFDKINHLPKRYLMDLVGQGMTGIIFDYPGGKIEKISYNGFTKSELKFYGYLKKYPIPEFPKVYSLEKDQLIVEKLETSSPKLDRWGEYIRKYRIKEGLHREIDLDKVLKELGKNHEFYVWSKNIYEGLYKILGVRTFGDISPKNIGERKSTGEIVFFDPIGGSLLMN